MIAVVTAALDPEHSKLRPYRTEIVIPADRVVTLHLPDDIPPGLASVIVECDATPAAGDHIATLSPTDDDRTDIEWWEALDARLTDG